MSIRFDKKLETDGFNQYCNTSLVCVRVLKRHPNLVGRRVLLQ